MLRLMRPNLSQLIIYNAITEVEQVTTLLDLGKMLETIKDLCGKHMVLASDYKTNSEKGIYSQIDLCDTWRIRNPKTMKIYFLAEECFWFNSKML